MRSLFFGTPIESVPFLDELIESGVAVPLVVTQPPRRRSRRGGAQLSPVHERAQALGLPVATPETKRDLVQAVAGVDADLALVVAYGRIIPMELLAACKYVNVHFSKLPRWRGAAPVERALLAGDEETAVALMEMDEGLDTGGVLAERVVAISPSMTAGELMADLIRNGTDLLGEHLPLITSMLARPQSGDPTYAAKLQPDEFRIAGSCNVLDADRMIRAGNPKPGAFVSVDGERIKIWQAEIAEASTGDTGVLSRHAGSIQLHLPGGSLHLKEIQPAGRARMGAVAWWNGLNAEQVVLD